MYQQKNEGLAHSTVAPKPPSTWRDGNMPARPLPGLDAFSTEPSMLARPGENGNDASEARGGDSDLLVDDQSQVLSKIKKLQDELVKAERRARQGQKLENMENRWESEFDRVGSEVERKNWTMFQQMRAQSYIKDTTAFAVGREWVHDSEDSFIWNMLEREEQDKRLTERRAQWEARKGITQPNVDPSLKPAWLQPNPHVGPHRPSMFPAFLDPLSAESRFNSTFEAQGYDAQERSLRNQMHDVVRSKHDAFVRWRGRPAPPPVKPNANSIDVWPRPVVNYVQWKTFRYCSPVDAFMSELKKDLFAIDVLDGEPDLNASRESVSIPNDKSKVPAGIPKTTQGFVPERIRLNGPQFAETFCALGCDRYSSSRSELVLLQPYRLLVYLDQDIRKRYADLKEKLDVPTDHREDLGCHETTHGDAGKESHGGSDAGAQPSQKVETGADSGHEAGVTTQNDVADETHRQPEDKPSEVIEDKEEKYPLANTKTALAYLGCLIDFMDTTISARLNYIRGPECRKIYFRDLWYLFNPGDEVVRRDEKQVYRVIEVTNPMHRASTKNIFFNFDDEDHSKNFQVSCVFVDFDGKKIGPVSTKFVIKAFAGERSIDSLEVYPLRLHWYTADNERKGHSTKPDSQTLRQQLIKRGKKFFEAARMKLENTFYDGPTADGDEVESQVVVDFETALSSDNNFHESLVPQLESLLGDADDSSSTSSLSFGGEVRCMALCCNEDYVCDDSFVDEKRKEEYIDSLIPKNTYAKLPSVAIYPRFLDDTAGDNALTDDEFLLMSYRVFAFVLRTRKWGESFSLSPADLFFLFNRSRPEGQI